VKHFGRAKHNMPHVNNIYISSGIVAVSNRQQRIAFEFHITGGGEVRGRPEAAGEGEVGDQGEWATMT
jgi:hypothetical protein